MNTDLKRSSRDKKLLIRLYAARLDAGRYLYGREGVDLLTIEGLEAVVNDLERLYAGENWRTVIKDRIAKGGSRVVIAMCMIATMEFRIEKEGRKAVEVSLHTAPVVRGDRGQGGKVLSPDAIRGLCESDALP